ncbi:MAG: fumarate reductase subunit [Chloroflexota bacterium]|nr:fumarate reductase subunit [Chloroflexota bacterium]
MYRINTIEPLWWALFGAGGMVAALILPIMILIFGVFIPMGAPDPAAYSAFRLHNLLDNWIVKLFLLAVIALPLFHWAHRFRYVLFDLGVRGARMPIAVACYGLAILGTILTAVVLIKA